MPAFFVCTVHNAATLTARAFYATGRVLSDYGPRRIRQNTRHFIDPTLEDEAWIRRAATIPHPTPAKFPTLDTDDQAAIIAACRPGLERLGYTL